jgi:hypothetical protein
MAPLAVQLLTILGVAVGAMSSFISTRLLDQSRWHREETLRWDVKRLDGYDEFASAIRQHIHISRRLCAELGLPSSTQPIGRTDGLELLSAASHDTDLKWERLLMLGTPPAIKAASAWRECAWHMEWLARGLRTDPAEYAQLRDQILSARNTFYSAVRADLGIAGAAPEISDRTAWRMRLESQNSTPSKNGSN